MVFVASPGVAQVKAAGKVGPNAQAQILHWYAGVASPWTQSQIDALNSSVRTHWGTNILPLLSSNVFYDLFQSVDLSDQGNRIAEALGSIGAGTSPGPYLPLSSSVMLNYHINSRYRGGHARTYLPPSGSTNCPDGDTWAAAFVTSVHDAWAAFVNAVNTDLQAAGVISPTQCCPRYTYTYTDVPAKHKWTKQRSGFLGPFPILSTAVSNQVRTQRRRLGE